MNQVAFAMRMSILPNWATTESTAPRTASRSRRWAETAFASTALFAGECGRSLGHLGLEVVRCHDRAFGGEASHEGVAGEVADGGD